MRETRVLTAKALTCLYSIAGWLWCASQREAVQRLFWQADGVAIASFPRDLIRTTFAVRTL